MAKILQIMDEERGYLTKVYALIYPAHLPKFKGNKKSLSVMKGLILMVLGRNLNPYDC